MTERQSLEYLKSRLSTQKNSKETKAETERKRQNKTMWTVFWRKNINLYISSKLQLVVLLNLLKWQHMELRNVC